MSRSADPVHAGEGRRGYRLLAGPRLPINHVAVNVSTADFYTARRKAEGAFGRAGISLEHLIEVSEDSISGRRGRVVAREIAALRWPASG